MRKQQALSPPPRVALTRVVHTVSFYETDAMGIVHHSNYLRFLEHARVQFLADHDRPYLEYMAEGLHVPVTRAEMRYHRPCRFADEVEVLCWLAWARSASLGFAYRLEVKGLHVASGETDHAITNMAGVPVRLPEHMREKIGRWLGQDSDTPPAR